ncbi:DNA polymerase V [Geothermobacter ehrlichii]|uniref:DNA polymerase V n=1 Tax=Geothermobacter ehrlichii TaxID=213224 RepID=A0A5D3WHJ1_9BACT|nr:translesion error-prone DNA polymerase V subunit UmuC [Geothermobacter ehrlichii]TYO96322.1 DNA polymerase V [Geothermobacter ehrlichii]
MRRFALVDCNNFYCSCERLFRPDLKRVPVVVLSNNDGCIVARSPEARALGIGMGVPLFKVRETVRRHNVRVFSSNYALYGDISARVMQTLERFSPDLEIYSIDEAFLDLSGVASPVAYGQEIRATVRRHVGVPVSVGIAPTKTLAKLANYAAKRFAETGGVVDLSAPHKQRRLLAITPVGEVWGVGRRIAASLQKLGVTTALDLARMEPRRIRRRFSVVLERTVRELNGESCIGLEAMPAAKKQIVCSRSFGEKLTGYAEVRQAVCEFAARTAEKLRREELLARMVHLFIRTSPFDGSGPGYSNAATGTLPCPSADSRAILALVTRLFDDIWKDGCRYAKAGVMLGDLCSPDQVQPDLFTAGDDQDRSDRLMRAIDAINHSGRGKIWFGGQRPQTDWFMRRAHLSPAYTTRWECIPEVC